MLTNPFHSFWMAGYECSDKLNAFGERVHLQHLTGHLCLIDADYRDVAAFGVRTVREGICWSVVEPRPYVYDWSSVTHLIRAAQKAGIQQVWDVCHFGFPDDLTPLHPMFARRFVALCRAFVLHFRSLAPDAVLIVTPVNEVSFLSWLGGDVAGTSPYCTGQGWAVKYALMRAYIEGCHALREADPGVRLLSTEPLVNMVPPVDPTPEQVGFAAEQHALQFQALDMLRGAICPELGGHEALADILGFNFYYNNQWIAGTGEFLPWVNTVPDPRWRSLSSLMKEVYQRYQRPMIISETSHPGEDRPPWMQYIGDEVVQLLGQQLPLWGVCLYPIIDRPDWDHTDRWHHSGLWDAVLKDGMPPQRVLYAPYAAALRDAQEKVQPFLHGR